MKQFDPAPIKSEITIEDINKIDIRVGKINKVEDIPKSKNIMRLTVDFGDHIRIILAGIKQERKNPKEVEGKQALFVVNLKPRKMMGEISEGMLFDLGYSDKIAPVLAIPEVDVPNGTRAE